MRNCADAALLTLDERLRELASILAIGVTRLRQRAALPAEKGADYRSIHHPMACEISAETRLSVRVGNPA
jgi:hypothetical protein